jgi:hypothetical protein
VTREQIVEGLKRWARGYYPAQAAVTFLAATNEPLTRVWVQPTPVDGVESYWINWDEFDDHSGVLSGGEYATWALAHSLHEGELNEHLWRIDPDRSHAFAVAIATARENWTHG